MKSLKIFAILTLVTGALFAIEGRIFHNPDLSGNSVVFTYENDLWRANLDTGVAQRITAHPGRENHPVFSPDGQWIAFSAQYDGGYDLYLMPATGGEPKRLTYHPSFEVPQGFTADGNAVTFTSWREKSPRLYKVPVSGGFPVVLPLDRVRYAALSPDGTKIAYNRERADRMNWKGYKGGQEQDIWLADLNADTYTRMTTWAGYDNHPMWLDVNTILFTSDRETGRMNLCSLDITAGTVKRLTNHTTWDVEMPAMDEATGRVIYVCAGYLYIYNPADGSDTKLTITIPTERWRTRSFRVAPSKYLHSVSLDSEGKNVLAESRGDIFLLNDDEEKAINLTATSGSREIEPVPSPDGKQMAFFSDKSGEFCLYIAGIKPHARWKQLTNDAGDYYYHILWSPDGKKLLYGDKNYTLRIADVESGTVTILDDGRFLKDNEIFWEVSDYHWSPDSRYIVYSLPTENMNNAISIYDTTTGEKHALTDGYYDDFSPVFDAGGRYLYFLSQRNFKPLLDPFMDNNVNIDTTCLMMVQLRKGEPLPFTHRWKAFLDDLKEAKEITVTIDWEGIDQRIFTTPLAPGTYKALEAGKMEVWFLSKANFGFPGIEEFFHPKSVRDYTLEHYDIKEKKRSTIIDGIGSAIFSYDHKKFAYMAGKKAGVVDATGKHGVGDGSLDWQGLHYIVDTSEEYRQILRDEWRQIRDFFYDPGIHGKDWQAVYDKYAQLLPYVTSREDINTLIGGMIGELTASHEYIIGHGGPNRECSTDHVSVGMLGADITLDRSANRYRLQHIIQGRSDRARYRSPLQAPDVQAHDGDYILKIDGEEVTGDKNFYAYLTDRAGKEVDLTLNDKPTLDGARTVTVKTRYGEYTLRYWDWVTTNRKRVDEAFGGKVGYMYLSDMDEEGLSQFEEAYRALRYRDGLIIDVRNNGGGFVSWFIIDKLERAIKYMAVTRDFATMVYPHGARRGPIVVLCNGGTGSDGEVFSQHFKDLHMGTLIGTRTWGGLIGIINMIPLIDGGMVTQSNVGFANLTGTWVVENHGVDPDIVVEMDPASALAGKDPQMEKAIEVLKREMVETPPVTLTPPPFPIKKP